MTERLDRIEQSIQRLSTALDALVEQFIRPLAQQSVANQELITANGEAIGTLLDMQQQTERDRTEQNQRVENLLQDARADRQQAERDRTEQSQRIEVLLQDAKADREENRRRFDAQQQISQAMLLELARVNSRLEVLERAG